MNPAAKIPDLASFDEELKQKNLEGLWKTFADHPLRAEPAPRAIPWVWRWSDLSGALKKAEQAVNLEGAEDRRVIRMVNPGIGSGGPSSLSMQFSFQLVKPGEIARAHRHTIAAVRFIVKGRGAYTTVEGERFEMAPGDLVLTPSWTWHDHGNYADEPMIWLDGLDYPLLDLLETGFFQPYNEAQQRVVKNSRATSMRTGAVRPERGGLQARDYPMHYRWQETLALLADLKAEEKSPYDGASVEYVNPVTGGPTLKTLACSAQMLQGGEQTAAHRHTSTSLYHVIEGEGVTRVGGEALRWDPRDCFVVPAWMPHAHQALSGSARALLFCMSDRPVYEALGLYREERIPLD